MQAVFKEEGLTMRRFLNGFLVIGLAVGLAGTLHAQVVGPTADVVIDGDFINISPLFTTINGLYVIPTQIVTDPISGLSVQVGVIGKPDPVLSYSFAATNPFPGSVPFAFDAAIPLGMPVPAGSTVTTSVGYSLTDGGSDGVTLTPLSTLSQHATGDGVDLGLNVGPAETGAAGSTTVFGPPMPGFSLTGTAPFTFSTLDIHLGFTLSGGGDNAGITGRVSTSAVPEPGTVALVAGLGVSGGAFALRRKRRA